MPNPEETKPSLITESDIVVAWARGKITEEEAKEAYRRILAAKQALDEVIPAETPPPTVINPVKIIKNARPRIRSTGPMNPIQGDGTRVNHGDKEE